MKKIALTILALTTFSQSSWAILDEKKISIQEAIEKALQTNPQIQMLDMDIEISKNNTKAANRLQNPSIDVFKSMGKAIESEPQLIGGSYKFELFKRGKRKQHAKTQEAVAQNNRYFSQYDLILDVRKAYIDLLLKKSNLNIRKHQEKLARELYESMQKDVKSGKIPETEALQAKIALSRTIMAVNNAKSNVIFSQNRFNTVLNSSNVNYDTKEDKLNGNYHDLLTIEPTDDLLKFDKIKEFALQNRYDLKKARQEVLAAQKKLEVVKSQLIPDVELQAGYGYRTSSNGDSGSFENGAYIGASLVNIPLFYQYKPEIKNAKLEIEKAQLKYKDVEIDALRSITDAWEKFVITRENLNFYNDELLSNSKELLNASIKGLANKELDLTAFLVTKRTYFDLMLEYQQALADFYISYAELVCEMNIIEVEKEFI
ncbi:MAG: TolC family protein [Candidatus Gastranaerophilales bacterium]|nr:TolC family protein [Candidatus Gastranaerophilales bacterium]